MSKDIHDHGDKQVRIVHDIFPSGWDAGPLSLAHEIRQLLKSVADEGTGIDSGGGDGCADLWVTIGGVEYHLAIERSKKQIASQSKP